MTTCKSEVFETLPDGDIVYIYKIDNGRGVTAEVLSYGGIIHSLCVPDKNGTVADVVLGQNDIAGYKSGYSCAASFIGRVANRISGGQFIVNGKTYNTEKNLNDCTLHSASGNYADRNLKGEVFNSDNCSGVKLSLRDNGEGGFPGGMDVSVTYSLDSDRVFKLRYEALPEEDTPISFTNHVYFNLAGHKSGSVSEQMLQLNADYVLKHEKMGMPTGEILSVKGTDMDFTSPKPIGQGFNSKYEQLSLGGYDHNYCIRGHGMRRGGFAKDPISSRCMEFFTDMPGVQLYTGIHMFDKVSKGKDGAEYRNGSGFCLETQHYPNSVNQSQFPSPYYKAGEKFISETIYRFYAE